MEKASASTNAKGTSARSAAVGPAPRGARTDGNSITARSAVEKASQHKYTKYKKVKLVYCNYK